MAQASFDNITHFTDPVHGQIAVNDTELLIINSPAFQRLRKIKQLGNVHFVFPGAVHTRFSHSLGVMHLAGRYFDSLFRQALQEANKDVDLAFIRIRMRLAGLLHDVGHGPFSHLFEKFLRKKIDGKDETFPCQVKDLVDQIKIPATWLNSEKEKTYFLKDLEHEDYSLGIIKYTFERIGLTSEMAQDVCSLISDDVTASDEFRECVGRVAGKHLDNASADSLMRCLHFVISGELDVDKLDYLVRDAFFCGTNIGSIDTDFLLNSIELKSIAGDGKSKNLSYIEIRGSAIPAFEQVLISRKQMFNRVYYHRVNLAFDNILEKIVDQLVKKSLIEYPKDYNSFMKMTDDWLEGRINAVLTDRKFDKDPETRRLAQMYLTRTMPKRVEGKEDEIVPHYRVKDRTRELKKLYSDTQNDPVIVTVPLKELTRLERDIKLKDGSPHIIRIKPDTIENQAISISYISDLLRSSLWRDISTRVIVFQPHEKSADARGLAQKVGLLPR